MFSLKSKSIQKLISEIKRTFNKYPLVLFAAMSSTILACLLIGENKPNNTYLTKGVFTLMLGVPLFFTMNVLKNSNWNPLKINKKAYPFVGMAFLMGIYFLFTQDQTENYLLRYMQYWFSIHLFVSVVLFQDQSEVEGFWEYNKSLFIQFIITTIYSAFLWAGLSLILASITYLFEVKIVDFILFE